MASARSVLPARSEGGCLKRLLSHSSRPAAVVISLAAYYAAIWFFQRGLIPQAVGGSAILFEIGYLWARWLDGGGCRVP